LRPELTRGDVRSCARGFAEAVAARRWEAAEDWAECAWTVLDGGVVLFDLQRYDGEGLPLCRAMTRGGCFCAKYEPGLCAVHQRLFEECER
jgi:hypothetical protein